MAKFSTFEQALAWAKIYGRECTLPNQIWRIEKLNERMYVVAVRSKVTGALVEYAEAA